MKRRMRWLAGVAGLLALSGCGADGHEMTPSPTPEPTLSDSELVEAGSEAYQAFLDELYAMYAEFDYDYTRLTPFASDSLATEAVAEIQMTHQSGINIDSTATVATATLRDAASASISVCVDARGTRAFDIESGVELEATGDQITAWTLVLEVSADLDVIVASRIPAYEELVTCDSLQ